MWGHLKNLCKKYSHTDKKQKVLSFEKTLDFGDSLKAVQFNQLACRQKLCEMIVIDELPFNHFEGQGLKFFCALMQPRFVIPSRMTVKRDVVKLYFSEMAKLKKRVDCCWSKSESNN